MEFDIKSLSDLIDRMSGEGSQQGAHSDTIQGETLEDYLRNQLGFKDPIDSIMDFILRRGQKLYRASTGSLDQLFDEDNNLKLNKEVLLSPQHDASFAFRRDFDYLLGNFVKNEKEAQSFFD